MPLFTSALLGLSIQPQGMYFVKCKIRSKKVLIEQVAFEPLMPEIFTQTAINDWERLTGKLMNVAAKLNLTGAITAVNVSADAVRMQSMQLPAKLAVDEIEAEIYAHLQQDMAGMAEALCVDFFIKEGQKPGYVTIVFAAIREEYINGLANSLQQAKLKLRIIDIDIYALQRAVVFILRWEKLTSPFAIFYKNRQQGVLLVSQQQHILFYERFEIINEVYLADELQCKLQLFHAAFPQVNVAHLALCGTQKQSAAACTRWEVHNVAERLALLPHFKLHEDMGFVPALGLALRDVPRW